jgi:GH15 family glucan-1,4-alpha-glucosidase
MEDGRPPHGYPQIADHGIIGDLRSCALVSTEGVIDWFCCPRFDSPSLFAALLDRERGGWYRIAPEADGHSVKQLYFPDTNVLITRFLTPDGVCEVQDFMPIPTRDRPDRRRIVRRVVVVRGHMPLVVECHPAFDYGRASHDVVLQECGIVFRAHGLAMALEGNAEFRVVDGNGVHARFDLQAGETRTFTLTDVEHDYQSCSYGEEEAQDAFEATVAYWRRWLGRSTYRGRWREMVNRSALTLKLLVYDPTGAIVAAPTTSLPEDLGGERNWDYRYTWIRDAAFVVYALLRLGFQDEAEAFMGWLRDRFAESQGGESGPLQVMYAVDGDADLPEMTLDHFEGYRGSAPVRIGNDAATQLQLDIYGELLDSVYLYNKYAKPLSYDAWTDLCRVLEWLEKNWDRPDEGIWEVRGGRQKFTYSRVMSWIAFDRAIRVARQRGLPTDLVNLLATRDAIMRQIMEEGWHPARQAFVQSYGSSVLDASVLLMPLTKFIAPNDPRWTTTLAAIRHELVSDSLVYRYNVEAAPDGLRGAESTFSICSFWYVEALARAGHLDDARLAFEKMLTYANHLGLYSEEIGPTGESLGNFPQAFTHLSLISAAVNLDYQLDRAR